jgi:hypothetical protein
VKCSFPWTTFALDNKYCTDVKRHMGILSSPFLSMNRDSAVGIATGYEMDDRGVGFRVQVGSIIFSTSSNLALGPTEPPIQRVPANFSSGVNRPGREADHSPPTNAEIKKTWIYTSTPYTSSWRNAQLVKHSDNLPLSPCTPSVITVSASQVCIAENMKRFSIRLAVCVFTFPFLQPHQDSGSTLTATWRIPRTSGNRLCRRRRPRSTMKGEEGRKEKPKGNTRTVELWGKGGKATAAINRRYIGSGCWGMRGWRRYSPSAGWVPARGEGRTSITSLRGGRLEAG